MRKSHAGKKKKKKYLYIYKNKYRAYDACTQYTLNMIGRALFKFLSNQLFLRILSSINAK
jgi:hypothetical protein